MTLDRLDKRLLRASLLGGAVGDSLGADIEFLTLSQIRTRFPKGITDLPAHHGITGAITDDTQMTLFTAEGLIEAIQRRSERGIWSPTGSVHQALLRWLETQGGRAYEGAPHSGLITDPRLHARRAPGLTCLSALETNPTLGSPVDNDSNG